MNDEIGSAATMGSSELLQNQREGLPDRGVSHWNGCRVYMEGHSTRVRVLVFGWEDERRREGRGDQI